MLPLGFPGGTVGKEPTCQCRRREFDLWVRKIPWRRKQQPTPVFLPGRFQGQRSLASYSPWGHRESDTTERPHVHMLLLAKLRTLWVSPVFPLMFFLLWDTTWHLLHVSPQSLLIWDSFLLFPSFRRPPQFCRVLLSCSVACPSVWLCLVRCYKLGFPSGASGREPACQCRRRKRHGFNPWVRRIPWRMKLAPVFLPGKFHGQRSLVSYSPWR